MVDMVDLSANFAGSIPEYDDKCLGPAWFQAFAADLAQRLPVKPAGDVLELACGTGIVTRRLRERIDPTLRLVASDLSKAMLTFAPSSRSNRGGIACREADAAGLLFDDGEFAAVVAHRRSVAPDTSARRSGRHAARSKKGGTLLFNVWDCIERNRYVEIHRLASTDLSSSWGSTNVVQKALRDACASGASARAASRGWYFTKCGSSKRESKSMA